MEDLWDAADWGRMSTGDFSPDAPPRAHSVRILRGQDGRRSVTVTLSLPSDVWAPFEAWALAGGESPEGAMRRGLTGVLEETFSRGDC